MTARIYDVQIDELRPVTQVDVDRLQLQSQCYGQMIVLLREILALHERAVEAARNMR